VILGHESPVVHRLRAVVALDAAVVNVVGAGLVAAVAAVVVTLRNVEWCIAQAISNTVRSFVEVAVLPERVGAVVAVRAARVDRPVDALMRAAVAVIVPTLGCIQVLITKGVSDTFLPKVAGALRVLRDGAVVALDAAFVNVVQASPGAAITTVVPTLGLVQVVITKAIAHTFLPEVAVAIGELVVGAVEAVRAAFVDRPVNALERTAIATIVVALGPIQRTITKSVSHTLLRQPEVPALLPGRVRAVVAVRAARVFRDGAVASPGAAVATIVVTLGNIQVAIADAVSDTLLPEVAVAVRVIEESSAGVKLDELVLGSLLARRSQSPGFKAFFKAQGTRVLKLGGCSGGHDGQNESNREKCKLHLNSNWVCASEG